MITFVEDQRVGKYTYLNSLNLTYWLNPSTEMIVATCSCCGLFNSKAFLEKEEAKLWLAEIFEEYKAKITEDGRYFLHEYEGEFLVGELKTGMSILLSGTMITSLFKGCIK